MKEAEHQTWRERQVTRRLLQDKEDEVLQLLEVSELDMAEAIAKATADFQLNLKSEERQQLKLRNEGKYLSNKAAKSHASQRSKMDAERRGFEAVIKQIKDQHSKEVARLNTTIQ